MVVAQELETRPEHASMYLGCFHAKLSTTSNYSIEALSPLVLYFTARADVPSHLDQ
jgi:hypothetical protein